LVLVLLRNFLFFALVFVLNIALPARAAPMAYFAGGAMTMLEATEGEREAGVNYALSPRDAIGLRYTWMRSKREVSTASHSHNGLTGASFTPQHESVEVNYTRLLQRWNTENAQINIWALGGLGAMRGNTFTGEQFFYSPGLQVDAESTRLYASLKAQMHRSKGVRNDMGVLRAGFSFWESEYDETQPWLIVEAKRTREFSEKIEITPMLRLINKNFFAELGVNQDKQVKAGLMVIFSRM
jgi:hypothetical protein